MSYKEIEERDLKIRALRDDLKAGNAELKELEVRNVRAELFLAGQDYEQKLIDLKASFDTEKNP